jgi:hypothetical protein
VTLADDGQTIKLRVGEDFLLFLGEDLNWTVEVADPAVVSAIPSVVVIGGSQGVYRANAPGQTQLAATGDPPCRQARPPCLAPSRLFRITLVVS